MSNKHKHLEFIEAVITRMSHHSFLIKGWTVTLLAALLALAATSGQVALVWPGFVVVPAFWWLDAFFLWTERRYRLLYDQVRVLSEAQIDFAMKAPAGEESRWQVAGTETLKPFYLALLVVLGLVVLVGR